MPALAPSDAELSVGPVGHAAEVVGEAALVTLAGRVDGEIGSAVQPQIVVAGGLAPITAVHATEVWQDEGAGCEATGSEEPVLAEGRMV